MLTEKTILMLNDIYSQDEYQHNYCLKISEIQQNSIDEDEKKIIELLWKVQHPYLMSGDMANPYGRMVESTDGSTTISIYELSDSDLMTLQSLDLESLPIMLKARISDILWIIKKDYQMAVCAFWSYILLGKQYIAKSEGFYHGVEYIERAMYISKQIGKSNAIHRQWFDETEKILIEISSGNETWVPNRLIGFLLQSTYKDYCVEAKKNVYLNILEKQIQHWESSFANITFIKYAFTTIKDILKGNNEKQKEYDIKLALIYRNFVQQSGHVNPNEVYASIEMLNSARVIYHKYAMSDEVREIIDIVTPLQQKALDLMVPISNSIDISDFVGEFPSILEALNKNEKLDFLSEITLFYQKNKAIERVIARKEQSPFSDLFATNILNDRGEVELQLPPLSDNMDVVILHAYRDVTQYELPFYAHYLSIILAYIKNDTWEESDLDFLFSDNWLIPENVANTLKRGIILGMSGDINAAASFFLSSVEPIVRNYVNVCGGIITLLREDGTTELKTLGSLLKDEKFVEICDENILFTLDAFLNSKAGSNVKNNFSHGRNNWQNNTVVNTYLFCLILKLCYIGSQEGCARNVKLKKNAKYMKASEVWANNAHSRILEEPEEK